jgi:hypothetical protein
VLPQVLAGLGIISFVSVGCLVWLQRLQPLFLTAAVTSLLWQWVLVWRRPAQRRKRRVRAILAISLVLNVTIITGWVALLVRYR